MKKTLFISHSVHDKNMVDILARIIREVSFSQIVIWFSSDADIMGGIGVGANWLETILYNLRLSQAVINFVTPNSNNQPWLLFESGYAEAIEGCYLIPVVFSMNLDSISEPLKHKQIYTLSSLEDMHIFLGKLLNLFEITYDKEIFDLFVQKSFEKMRRNWTSQEEGNVSCFDDINASGSYDIILEYEIYGVEKKEYLTIKQTDTLRDILNRVYLLISDVVKPYTYLEKWVLYEKKTQTAAIVCADLYEWILAKDIFKLNSLWKIVYLKESILINQ